jgi:hypothetical protein
MARRMILVWVARIALAGAVIATPIKWGWNWWEDQYYEKIQVLPSTSASEARARGIFVARVSLSPAEIDLPEGKIIFREAWLEEKAVPSHRMVWLPYERKVGGCHVCITLTAGRELFTVEGLFLVPGKAQEGFAAHATERELYFTGDYNGPVEDNAPIELSLLKSWKTPPVARVTLTVENRKGGTVN